jgi:hypothetical protein
MLAMPDILPVSPQVLVTIQIVVYVFAIYMIGIISFIWSCGIADALVPFAVEFIELLMVAWIGSHKVHLYPFAGAIIGLLGVYRPGTTCGESATRALTKI